MLLHELLAGDIYPSNPPLTHQAANTYTCSCCYHFQSVPNFAGSSQVNPHRSHWRQIVPPKGRKTLTNPSRGRRPRKAAAAPGLGGPPRRPAAGRCTGKQQRSQHRTLHIKKSTRGAVSVSTEPEGGSAGEGEPTVQGGAVGGCCDRRRGRRGEGAVVVAVRGRAGAGEGGGGGQLAGGVPGLLHRPGRRNFARSQAQGVVDVLGGA
jgi:hypothetical protein